MKTLRKNKSHFSAFFLAFFSSFGERLQQFIEDLLAQIGNIKPRSLVTREQLIAFLDKNAAYIAQKCAYAYCHARMGKLAYDALKEPFFQEKMEVCRWEGFAVILSDLVLLTAFMFKERLGKNAPTAAEFEKIYSDVLARHVVPAHRKNWRDRQKEFQRRLDAALKNRPSSVKNIAEIGGKALLKLVPLGDAFKNNDRDIFMSTVRLCEMNFEQELLASCKTKDMWQENIQEKIQEKIEGKTQEKIQKKSKKNETS